MNGSVTVIDGNDDLCVFIGPMVQLFEIIHLNIVWSIESIDFIIQLCKHNINIQSSAA